MPGLTAEEINSTLSGEPIGDSAVDINEANQAMTVDRFSPFRGSSELQASTELIRSLGGEALAGVKRGTVRMALGAVNAKTAIERNIELALIRLTGSKDQIGSRLDSRAEHLMELLASDQFRPSDDLSRGIVQPMNPRWWLSGIAEIVPQIATQLGMAAAAGPGRLFAQALGFAGPAVVSEAGNTYGSAITDMRASGITDPVILHTAASLEGLVSGMVVAATNTAQFQRILSLNKASAQAVTSTLTTSYRVALINSLKKFGIGGTLEAIQEMTEGTAQDIAEQVRKSIVGQDVDFTKDFWVDFFQRRLAEGLISFVPGGFIPGSVDFINTPRSVRFARFREAVADSFVNNSNEFQRQSVIRRLEKRLESEDFSEFDKSNFRFFIEKLQNQGPISKTPLDAESIQPFSEDVIGPNIDSVLDSELSIADAINNVLTTRDSIVKQNQARIRERKRVLNNLRKRKPTDENQERIESLESEIESIKMDTDNAEGRVQSFQAQFRNFLNTADVDKDLKQELTKIVGDANPVNANRLLKRALKTTEKFRAKSAQKRAIKALKSVKDSRRFSTKVKASIDQITSEVSAKKLSKQSVEELVAIAQKLATDDNMVLPQSIVRNIETLGKKPVSEMSADEANGLADYINALEAVDRQQKESIILGQKVRVDFDTEVTVGEQIGRTDAHAVAEGGGRVEVDFDNLKPVNGLPLTEKTRSTETGREKKPGTIKRLGFLFGGDIETLDTEGLFDKISGNEESDTVRVGYKQINDAQEVLFEGVDLDSRFIQQAIKESGFTEADARQLSAELADLKIEAATRGIIRAGETTALTKTLTLKDGRKVDMRVAEMMGLAGLLQDPYARDQIIFNGVKVKLRTGTPGTEFSLTKEDVDVIFDPKRGGLTNKQLALTNKLVRYMNGELRNVYRNWSNEQRGIDDTVKGFHYPVHRVQAARVGQGKDPDSNLVDRSNFVQKSIESTGITIARVGGTGAIEIRDIFSEFSNMSWTVRSLATIGPAIRHASKVFSDERTTTLWRRRYGDRLINRVNATYDAMAADIVGGSNRTRGLIEDVLSAGILNNVAIGLLGFSPRVAIGQVVSVIAANAELPGVYDSMGSAFDTTIDEEIRQFSPRLWFRKTHSVSGLVNEGGTGQAAIVGFRGKNEFAMAMIRGMDSAAIRVIWDKAKRVAQSKGLEGDDMMNHAADIAEKVVNRTQPTYDTLHVSQLAINARNNPAARLFTFFRAQRAKNLSIMWRRIYQAKRGSISLEKAISDIVSTMIIQSVVFIAVKELFSIAVRNAGRAIAGEPLSALRAGEDEIELSKRLAQRILSTISSQFVGGDLLVPSFSILTGQRAFDPEVSPPIALMADAALNIALLGKSAAFDQDWDKSFKRLIDLNENILPLLGIPAVAGISITREAFKEVDELKKQKFSF